MALRQGMRSLARLAGKGLPQRGGGGGPVKYAPAPEKPVSLGAQRFYEHGLSALQQRLLVPRRGAHCSVGALAAPLSIEQVRLWDEMWWDDGLMHSQPVLDSVGEPTLFTTVRRNQQSCVCTAPLFAQRQQCANAGEAHLVKAPLDLCTPHRTHVCVQPGADDGLQACTHAAADPRLTRDPGARWLAATLRAPPPSLLPQGQAVLQLTAVMGLLIGSIYATRASWNEDRAIYVSTRRACEPAALQHLFAGCWEGGPRGHAGREQTECSAAHWGGASRKGTARTKLGGAMMNTPQVLIGQE
jgi:hypothetical protein